MYGRDNRKDKLSYLEARLRAGLSVSEAAGILGVPEDELESFESGKKEPSATVLVSMCALYDIDARDLSVGRFNGKITLLMARKRAGLSRADVCKALGIAMNSLARYERGESEPGAIVFMKLCRLYEIPPESVQFDERLLKRKGAGNANERETDGKRKASLGC